MNQMQQLKLLGGAVGTLFMGSTILKSTIYTVDTGQKAFKFNAVRGVLDTTYREGYHLKIPYIEKPIIYNVKSTPQEFRSTTGSKDLQEVQLKVRVLFRPDPNNLQTIYRTLGVNY